MEGVVEFVAGVGDDVEDGGDCGLFLCKGLEMMMQRMVDVLAGVGESG